MGYNSRDWAAASHVFPFSRLLTVEVSSSFLHKGTNLLAVEVHRHAFSDSYVEFSVSTFLIGTEMKRQIRQFPVIRASTDVWIPAGMNGRSTMRRWSWTVPIIWGIFGVPILETIFTTFIHSAHSTTRTVFWFPAGRIVFQREFRFGEFWKTWNWAERGKRSRSCWCPIAFSPGRAIARSRSPWPASPPASAGMPCSLRTGRRRRGVSTCPACGSRRVRSCTVAGRARTSRWATRYAEAARRVGRAWRWFSVCEARTERRGAIRWSTAKRCARRPIEACCGWRWACPDCTRIARNTRRKRCWRRWRASWAWGEAPWRCTSSIRGMERDCSCIRSSICALECRRFGEIGCFDSWRNIRDWWPRRSRPNSIMKWWWSWRIWPAWWTVDCWSLCWSRCRCVRWCW